MFWRLLIFRYLPIRNIVAQVAIKNPRLVLARMVARLKKVAKLNTTRKAKTLTNLSGSREMIIFPSVIHKRIITTIVGTKFLLNLALS